MSINLRQINFSDISNLESNRFKTRKNKFEVIKSTKVKKSSKRLFKKNRNYDRKNKITNNNEISSSVCVTQNTCKCYVCDNISSLYSNDSDDYYDDDYYDNYSDYLFDDDTWCSCCE